MRIIDRDIQFYETTLEEIERKIRNCHPDQEAGLKKIRDATRWIIYWLGILHAEFEETKEKSQ